MSATVIPDLMPSSRTSWPGSPASSRSFSSSQIGLTMAATGRSGLGKAAAGTPDCAMQSGAAPAMVNAAAKTTVMVVRINDYFRATINMADVRPQSVADNVEAGKGDQHGQALGQLEPVR